MPGSSGANLRIHEVTVKDKELRIIGYKVESQDTFMSGLPAVFIS